MKKSPLFLGIPLTVITCGALLARGGNLDPGTPPGPTMHTLEEIYQKLDSLTLPTRELSDSTTEVVAGVYGATNLTQVDPDLVPENIRKGIVLFGLVGTCEGEPSASNGWVNIPAGEFTMGNVVDPEEGWADELPTHTVSVSAFDMERFEVTRTLWDEVADWAATNGYDIASASVSAKSANHPVYDVNWYECLKWCNARSQKEGRTPVYYTDGAWTQVYAVGEVLVGEDSVNWAADGYRLPTEAEWEKAARGGSVGARFSWNDFANQISHARANYFGESGLCSYDLSSGYHPDYNSLPAPFTSPAGSFPASACGAYDLTGNVWEWCWDRYSSSWYSDAGASDPDTRGPAAGAARILRGGAWKYGPNYQRVSYRGKADPGQNADDFGFRTVVKSGP